MSKSDSKSNIKTPLRRVAKNLGFLVRGRGIAALMSLGSTMLMARTLGPSEFGIVMLMLAYTLLVRGLFDFQLFESIVRFGVPAQESKDTNKLRRLISLCWRIDRRVSIGATLVALSFAPLAGTVLDLSDSQITILAAYSVVLLSTGNGTAIGILRLFDQFEILGRMMIIGPAIRFLGVVITWWLDGNLFAFVLVLGTAYIIENLSLIWYGWREYQIRIEVPSDGKKIAKVKINEFEGLRSFLWVTYWQSNLDTVPKHSVVMLAGVLLGTYEAGLLRLTREFSSILSNPAILVRQVLFLDLTRSWNQSRDDFKLLAYRTALIAGCIGLFFVITSYFFGEVLIANIAGEEFTAAAPLLSLMLLASTFELTASSLRSAAYAIGHAAKVLRWYVVSAVTYVSMFAGLIWWLGLIGAGAAACVSAIIPPIAMFLMIHKSKALIAKIN